MGLLEKEAITAASHPFSYLNKQLQEFAQSVDVILDIVEAP